MSAFLRETQPQVAHTPDAREQTTLQFEWVVRGLKNLFDSSKGESKSKVVKSPRFGDGQWQILFYANSGISYPEGPTMSLYLACEPTAAEREKAVNRRWSREGLFDFSFTIHNVAKTMEFATKSAHEHSFYFPGAQNWGWVHFATRDKVYYVPATVRQQDAFTIICKISTPLVPATSVPEIPRYLIPKDLLDSMGSLLDDSMYSDLEFVLPRRGREPRTIYASKKLLRRIDYYHTMFKSGFSESAPDADVDAEHGPADDAASTSELGGFAQQFDDSDFEDDGEDMDNDADFAMFEPERHDTHGTHSTDGGVPQMNTPTTSSKRISVTNDDTSEQPVLFGADMLDQSEEQGPSVRNTRPKLSHPSTPRSREIALEHNEARAAESLPAPTRNQVEIPGPRKTRIVVRDVAYSTYRAVLYYIYTDMINFAPLSSSFLGTSTQSTVAHQGSSVVSTPAALPTEAPPFSGSVGPRSRREWIAEWERANPDRMRPPSAKSVYRLAEQLGLQDLKERAFKHIIKSLTVDTVVHEVFSAFSMAFEDIRQVEIEYLFKHWDDVRKGAMVNIGQYLRSGRYPGFDEVWPVIIQKLVTDEKRGEGGEHALRLI